MAFGPRRSHHPRKRWKNSGVRPACMSATMAWNDFLQTSGQCPASLRMPPFCPPMPSAQVLQALRLVMARHRLRQPTRRAIRNEYQTAAEPPRFFARMVEPTVPSEPPP